MTPLSDDPRSAVADMLANLKPKEEWLRSEQALSFSSIEAAAAVYDRFVAECEDMLDGPWPIKTGQIRGER